MPNRIRTRIAPSPTGSNVHLGNLRTALFNYLVAAQNGGDFILRIEDSDQSRDNKEAPLAIYNTLCWMGLSPNEGFGTNNQPKGPYRQTEKLARYKEVAEYLVEKGAAYRCYCTEEELNKQRELLQAKDKKAFFKYPQTCRNRTDQPDKSFVIRFKSPTEGITEYNDVVFGHMKVPNIENQDFVILRADGSNLYNFGCVIDDLDNEINYVIRGKDHLLNQLPQIFLYKALDAKLPTFAHLPMMLDKNGVKLSKRNADVNLDFWVNAGYSPQSILNYLAKFGWAFGNSEIFSFNDLLAKFDIKSVKKSDGKFDNAKFATINYEHLKSITLTSDTEYVRLLKPFIDSKNIGNFSEEQLIPFINVIRSRAKTFVEAATMLEPMLKAEINPAKEMVQHTFSKEVHSKMEELTKLLSSIEIWSEQDVKTTIQNWLETKQILFKEIGAPLRVALLGQTNSPELFAVLNVLGKEKTINRINKVLNDYKN